MTQAYVKITKEHDKSRKEGISMGHCPIDHTVADVQKKLAEQQPYLPKELHEACQQFLTEDQDQETLNEVFHLLKKYDLASDEVKEERNAAFTQLFK